VTDEGTPIFERGDVVYGDDPFKGEEDARPWLIISNHEGRPFYGEQYIAVTLTSKSWMDGLLAIPEDIDFWQGQVESELIDEAVAALAKELQ